MVFNRMVINMQTFIYYLCYDGVGHIYLSLDIK